MRRPSRTLCLALFLLALLGVARVQSGLASALGPDPWEHAYDNPLTLEIDDVGAIVSSPVVYTDVMRDPRSSIVAALSSSALVTLPAVSRPGIPFRLSALTRAPPSS